MDDSEVDLSQERLAKIDGNASDDVKRHLLWVMNLIMRKEKRFADSIAKRLKLKEVSIREKADEPAKLEAYVVCEVDVEDDMLNTGGNVHGGCSAYLVDVCSTLPISALGLATGGSGVGGVSHVINMIYHSPAQLGDRLRIVNTSLALGARAMSARSEIWSTRHHRLVASGIHIKMDPSPPKL